MMPAAPEGGASASAEERRISFLDSRKISDLLKELYAKIEGIIASLETKIPEFESNNDVASQENVNTDESLTSLKIILKQLLRENLEYQRGLEGL